MHEYDNFIDGPSSPSEGTPTHRVREISHRRDSRLPEATGG